MSYRLFLLVILLTSCSFVFADTEFRVVTYNGLKFDANDLDRQDEFAIVFDDLDADIVLMQEIFSEAGAAVLLAALNSSAAQYAMANFIDGPDTDHMLFYKTDTVKLIGQDYIDTTLRSFAEYQVAIGGNIVNLYSAHLKASAGGANEQQRLAEVSVLRHHLNQLPDGSEFIIVGDMNIYKSSEPAYQKFMANEINNNGRAQDLLPADLIGNWHDNPDYTLVHSQSPRTTQFGGGATGGLCDRFDMILGNHGINDGMGIDYVVGSYAVHGNDGNHLNRSILDGFNGSVSADVAQALHDASDHLPVIADFISYADPAEEYAALPFYEDFEAAALASNWVLHTSNGNGRIELSAEYAPYLGTQHLVMSSQISANFTTNTADLKLNFEQRHGVTLRFYWKDFGDETHVQDGVYLSNDGGLSYTKIHDLVGGDTPNNIWQEIILDVDDLAASNNIVYTDTMILRFQQYDNWTINADGFAFDEIEIVSNDGYAALPYITGFEAGEVDGYWSLSSSNANGLVEVGSAKTPYAGDYHLLMASQISGNYTTNSADLRLNLSDSDRVMLDFKWKEFGDEDHDQDGLYFSNDGGVSFEKVFDLNGKDYINNTWQSFTLDVQSLASSVGLSLTDTFVIRFQQYDNWTLNVDGFAFDEIIVYEDFTAN